jgi:ATPase subunit of ABC transporter with duplicated ATPase domains
MRYELFMEAENDEFLILDEPTNYIKPISDIDSKK